MSNYVGVRCPVCNKKFGETDDVVVCPQCGAPHHRLCYAEKKECAFSSEHISGKEWHNPDQEMPKEGEGAATTKTCGNCGTSNPLDSIFCQVCGMRLSLPGQQEHSGGHYAPPSANHRDQQQYTPGGQPYQGFTMQMDPQLFVYGGVSPDEVLGGEEARDLAVFVGPNSAYYLPKFQRISRSAASLSLNVAALLLNFVYYFYRKMYLVGGILLALFAACLIPYCLYVREMLPALMQQAEFASLLARAGIHIALPTQEINMAAANSYHLLSNIMWMVFVAVGVVLSAMANRLYFRKAVATVRKIRENAAQRLDAARYHMNLSYYGGVSGLSVFLAISLAFAIYCVSASLAFYGIVV